jgi:hypothetical protein
MPDDWELAQTPPLNPDADDATTAGANGLSSLGNYNLHMSQAGTVNPLDLPGLPILDGQVDAILGIPSEVDEGNGVFTVYLDGTKAEDAEVFRAPDAMWHLQMDTMSLPNGLHYVQLAFECRKNLNDSNDHLLFGSTVPLLVNNPVTIHKSTKLFCDALYIEASAVPSSAYTVDIYDVDHNLLKTISGVPFRNEISSTWDLKDLSGNDIAPGPLQCEFTLTPAMSGGSVKAKARYKKSSHIQGTKFTVAFSWECMYHEDDAMARSVIDMLCPTDYAEEADYYFLPQGYNTPYLCR